LLFIVSCPNFFTYRSTEDSLPRLALLAEILGSKSLPMSLELTTHLLETLNKVVQSLPAAQGDAIYIQQLLMSAIESTSSKIKVSI
jgi:U3 small nucleolar RNA-associated protein 10